MTTIYDPKHPQYTDEADVRSELTRVFDLCHGCRLCFKFCTSFPTLFEMIDRHDDQDAGRLDRKSTRLNSSHIPLSRMPSSA